MFKNTMLPLTKQHVHDKLVKETQENSLNSLLNEMLMIRSQRLNNVEDSDSDL